MPPASQFATLYSRILKMPKQSDAIGISGYFSIFSLIRFHSSCYLVWQIRIILNWGSSIDTYPSLFPELAYGCFSAFSQGLLSPIQQWSFLFLIWSSNFSHVTDTDGLIMSSNIELRNKLKYWKPSSIEVFFSNNKLEGIWMVDLSSGKEYRNI